MPGREEALARLAALPDRADVHTPSQERNPVVLGLVVTPAGHRGAGGLRAAPRSPQPGGALDKTL
ncbi:hypothetical protein ACF06W_17955 [Streptomyces albus]|uniref:hypothetical protein n=1 Tax=Streptomyces albus TaxID=1888 RepID=UPI0036FDC960